MDDLSDLADCLDLSLSSLQLESELTRYVYRGTRTEKDLQVPLEQEKVFRNL